MPTVVSFFIPGNKVTQLLHQTRISTVLWRYFVVKTASVTWLLGKEVAPVVCMSLSNQPPRQKLRLLKEASSNTAGSMPAKLPACQSALQISDLPASTSLEPIPANKSGVGRAYPIDPVSLQNSDTLSRRALKWENEGMKDWKKKSAAGRETAKNLRVGILHIWWPEIRLVSQEWREQERGSKNVGKQTYKIHRPLQNCQGHGNSCLTLNYNSTLLPPRSLLASPKHTSDSLLPLQNFFSFVEITIIFIYFLTWTGFPYIAQAGPQVVIPHLYLLSIGITGVHCLFFYRSC